MTFCPEWNPYMVYVWTAKQMQSWVDVNGASGGFDGKRWKMIYKRLCPGRYEISFKEITQ